MTILIWKMRNEVRGSFRDLLTHFGRLPFNPFLSILENLLLPYVHGLFQAVYRVAACFERHSAVGRGDDDDDRGFRYFQRAETVDDTDAFDIGPTLANLVADAPHLFDGHRLVSFVLQADDAAALRVFAHDAAAGHAGPGAAGQQSLFQAELIDRLSRDFENILTHFFQELLI